MLEHRRPFYQMAQGKLDFHMSMNETKSMYLMLHKDQFKVDQSPYNLKPLKENDVHRSKDFLKGL